jgi:hypothetical protein
VFGDACQARAAGPIECLENGAPGPHFRTRLPVAFEGGQVYVLGRAGAHYGNSGLALITQLNPSFVQLTETYPLQESLTSSPATVWTSMPVVPTRANLVDTTKLPPALAIAGHTFSPLGTTGLSEVLKSLADIELPGLEGKVEGIGVLLSTARILSQLTSPSEKTTFEKPIFYSEQLLPIVNSVLDLVGRSHPALQGLKPGLDALAFVIKTEKCVRAIVCELKTGQADPTAALNAVIG